MTIHPRYATRATLPLAVGTFATILLFGGFGYWSFTAKIAGAVISPGIVQMESNRQIVQHPEGGVVSSILVKDGDKVNAGDPLITLESTKIRSELNIVNAQTYEILARSARLAAERDGLNEITFPLELSESAKDNPALAEQIQGQIAHFMAEYGNFEKEKTLLEERVLQIQNRIIGVEAQITALDTQLSLQNEELVAQQHLLEKQLTQTARILKLKSDIASIQGQIGKLLADKAEFRGQIASIEIEILKLHTGRKKAAIAALRDLQYSLIELNERNTQLQEALSRLVIKAPMSGIVFGSKVFALQSVIKPAEPIMYIVPKDEEFIISGRVDTTSVDQIRLGQQVILRFTAFDSRMTPELAGRVSKISADAVSDEASGTTYYSVELQPLPQELEKLGQEILVPGMPVEALIRTGDRTPIAYLVKPLADYFSRAMRG